MNGNWTVFQEGNVPGAAGVSNWMPAISMDGCGNIALMYDVAGTAVHPSIRYTGRNASDPLGTMTLPEAVILNATAGSTGSRWGDYNTAVQDYSAAGSPNDGSFWCTSQHSNQLTRIANFTLTGGCVPAPNVTAGAATITSESCIPNNGVIDPGETVTVSFCALNGGTANTVNLVGTLQATGGVTSPSGPQNYGVLNFGGPAVCRSFTFNATGVCGSTITASIQMQDGATNLGTLTYTFTLGTSLVSVSQNFDAVVAPALPAGWVATNASGPAPLWVTSTAGNPAPAFVSAPNSIFIDNPGVVSDKQIVTPSFTTGAGSRVSFANNFDLESGFDGGVLEISINGGAFTDIITAGGSFVAGGYTGVLAAGGPLATRNTWTGSSGGFTTTTVNLPPASAGLPCILKFRMGSDGSVANTGWRVDNYSITSPACCTGIGNDACAFAPTINCGQTITGTTVGSTIDAVPFCVTPLNTSPGVWYKFTGDGTTVTLSLCGGGTTYDSKIGVFSGTCAALTCVTGNDDFCGLQSEVTFVSVSGTDYFVLVTGFGGASGAFSLTRTCVGACTLTCPANITVNTAPGTCGAVVTFTPTTVGTCGTITSVPASGSVFPKGITTVNVTSTAGPTCSFTVTVVDNQPPTITCPATVTVSCASAVPAPNIASVTATDNCPGVVVTFVSDVISAQTCANRFTVTRTYRATDAAGLVANCTQTITVNDLTAPTITACPAAVTVSCAAAVPAVNLAAVTATDNCAGAVVISFISDVISAQTCANRYTLTRTYRATDVCGNFTNCVQIITVNDVTPPVVTCPANITATTPVGSCTAVVTFTPTATDNCAGAVTITSVPASGSAFIIGTTPVIVTATDVCGNSSTCSFLVTVLDGQLPTITAQPVNRTVCAGSSATFNVTAVTTPNAGGPIAYQWEQWNGSAWVNVTAGTGATTAALTFANVANLPQNTNTFRVKLTGLCTTVFSGAASLYINPLPTISLATSIPPNLLPGQSLNITATVNPGGGSFVWFKNGVVMPGVTGGVLSGLTVDDLGTYRAVYTDLNGCVSTSADVTLTGQPSGNLYVYPNPNTGVFQVRFYNTVNEAASVIIYDEKGARVFVQKFTTGTPYSKLDINISRSPAGTYLVEVVNGAGKRIAAKRIVKQL
jgi:HYR domain/Secretion system C-terminal sorting domain